MRSGEKTEKKKAEKRSALLNAAFQLFTEQGFQKTSISDIANQAEVAKGTFYLYFKDKIITSIALLEKGGADLSAGNRRHRF